MSEIIFEKKMPQGKFTVYNDKPELESLIHVHQVHSPDIIQFTGEDLSSQQVDGIYALNKNLNENIHFAIKTADCIPAVFIGHKGIAIIHAGWAGVRDKILIHPDLHKIEPYFCFFGPSIHLNSFEVQEDFYQHFPMGPNYHRIDDRLCFDLQTEATQQIKQTFTDIQVEDCGICTYESSQNNSYRRDKTKRRNWNIFSL